MTRAGRRRYSAAVALCIALSALVVTACGDDDDEEEASSKPTTLAITTTELGKKKFKTEAPASIEGGLVEIRFRNAGKAPHNAELLRIDGGHKVEEVFKLFDSRKPVIPDWLHFEGGVSTTAPGKTATAKLRLAPGDYAVIDTESEDGPPPALFGAKATFKVTGDNGGKLEETASKLLVKDKGHHEFEFVPQNLKAGSNELTFDNRSKQVHHLVAFPIVGKATLADVKKALKEEGKPSGPPPVDFEKGTSVSSIDGKKKLTTRINLSKGRNVLLCFLTDRDGKGKPHTEEGMTTEVAVQ